MQAHSEALELCEALSCCAHVSSCSVGLGLTPGQGCCKADTKAAKS